MNTQFGQNARREAHPIIPGQADELTSPPTRNLARPATFASFTTRSAFIIFRLTLLLLLGRDDLHADAVPTSADVPAPVPVTNATSNVWLSPYSDRVLVIYNADLPASFGVADYYASRRGIPRNHLLGIHPTSIAGYEDNYPYSAALTEIVAPITNALTRIGPEKILYFVFTYGTPYSVFNDVWKYPRAGSIKGASLDSYLSDPYDEAFSGTNIGAGQNTRFYANPYAPGTNATPHAVPGGIDGPINAIDTDRNPVVVTNVVTYPPFEPLAAFRARTGKRVYAVFRLDGSTPAIARQQVDKAIQAEQAGGLDRLGGTFYFDRKSTDKLLQTPPPSDPWIYDRYVEWTLFRTTQMAIAAGFPWQQESTFRRIGEPASDIPQAPHAIFYAGTYGWYNTEDVNSNPQPDPWTWLPGAIGMEWKSEGLFGGPRGDNNPPNGSDLDPGWGTGAIAAGITATLGGIAEPLDEGVPRPDAILRNLLEGANIGDAFFRDAWYLGWQMLNVGDPLYVPFPGGRAPFNTASPPAPRIFFTPPMADTSFTPPATIRLQAVVPSSAKTPLQVEFFLATNSLAKLASEPFSATLTNLDFPPGVYSLTATATYADGTHSTSEPVSVSFSTNGTPAQIELAVSDLTPLVSSPLTITVLSRITDNNIQPIDIFAGTNLLGRATEPPFSITVSNLPAGDLLLSAKTQDLQGRPIFSPSLTLQVLRTRIIGQKFFNQSQFRLSLESVGIGTTNVIQVSTNLVDWISIGTNTAPANKVEFIDPDAQNFEQRFYRILSPL
ncbi:MAG: TIGR03790 family protein [Verrucomicrobia bacterium]|nr:TIGR03790 family protein [Verrucomicrobiota bacterium]